MAQTFTNPLFPSQDPYVIRWQGNYYYSDADSDRIYLRRSPTLSGLSSQAPIPVWNARPGSGGLANVWAPELHLIGGRWYLYFAADHHSDARHRLFVLEGGSDPLDPYKLAGQIVDSTGNWAIDPDVFFGADNQLYLTWSCTGDEFGRLPQNLCIARMSDPVHVASDTVQISSPVESWETRTGAIQEGPVGFVHAGSTYLTYSASASWTTKDYAVGVLINASGDLLNPGAWKKHGPVLDGHSHVYGPGSVVFINSPDGTESWSLYHAYDRLNCAQWACRSIRMQKIAWDSEGVPLLGYPMDPQVGLEQPSGDAGAASGWGDSKQGARAAGAMAYLSSGNVYSGPVGGTAFRNGSESVAYTVSADVAAGRTGRSGVYALYRDEANHVEVFLDGSAGVLGTGATVAGADQGIHWTAMPIGFDFAAAHHLEVRKSAEQSFSFVLDGVVREQRSAALEGGQIGVFSTGAGAQFRNVTLIDDAFGWGRPYGDAAEGGASDAPGLWQIVDARAVESRGAGTQALYRGNPNLQSYTVGAEVRKGGGSEGRVGLVACYDDRNNNVSMWLDAAQRLLRVHAVVNGISTWQNAGLPAGFDAGAWHALTAEKAGSGFLFLIDGAEMLRAEFALVNGMPGITTDGSPAQFREFAVTQP